jgi:hypothetical protein
MDNVSLYLTVVSVVHKYKWQRNFMLMDFSLEQIEPNK